MSEYTQNPKLLGGASDYLLRTVFGSPISKKSSRASTSSNTTSTSGSQDLIVKDEQYWRAQRSRSCRQSLQLPLPASCQLKDIHEDTPSIESSEASVLMAPRTPAALLTRLPSLSSSGVPRMNELLFLSSQPSSQRSSFAFEAQRYENTEGKCPLCHQALEHKQIQPQALAMKLLRPYPVVQVSKAQSDPTGTTSNNPSFDLQLETTHEDGFGTSLAEAVPVLTGRISEEAEDEAEIDDPQPDTVTDDPTAGQEADACPTSELDEAVKLHDNLLFAQPDRDGCPRSSFSFNTPPATAPASAVTTPASPMSSTTPHQSVQTSPEGRSTSVIEQTEQDDDKLPLFRNMDAMIAALDEPTHNDSNHTPLGAEFPPLSRPTAPRSPGQRQRRLSFPAYAWARRQSSGPLLPAGSTPKQRRMSAYPVGAQHMNGADTAIAQQIAQHMAQHKRLASTTSIEMQTSDAVGMDGDVIRQVGSGQHQDPDPLTDVLLAQVSQLMAEKKELQEQVSILVSENQAMQELLGYLAENHEPGTPSFTTHAVDTDADNALAYRLQQQQEVLQGVTSLESASAGPYSPMYRHRHTLPQLQQHQSERLPPTSLSLSSPGTTSMASLPHQYSLHYICTSPHASTDNNVITSAHSTGTAGLQNASGTGPLWWPVNTSGSGYNTPTRWQQVKVVRGITVSDGGFSTPRSTDSHSPQRPSPVKAPEQVQLLQTCI